MKFLIKVEASKSIGFGHIKRQITLARALEKRGAEILFAVRDKNFLSDKIPFSVIHCPNSQDFGKLGKTWKNLIIDEPQFPKEWYKQLGDFRFVIGIDEIGPLRDHLDLHFCTTLLGLENRGQRRGKTQEYIGPKYFIFEPLTESNNPDIRANSVLLSFGGSDPGRLSEKFLNGVQDLSVTESIAWIGILGPGFSPSYQTLLKERFTFVDWIKSPESLTPYYSQCSQIICAGGVTPYEALRQGCYPYILAQKQEQTETGRQLEDARLATYFGDCDRIDWFHFQANFLRPSKKAAETLALDHFQTLIEGDSTLRLVEIILKYVQS
jgi:spore coat polysaccharide biosynthesis predicted glycosyltransferase SpsG